MTGQVHLRNSPLTQSFIYSRESITAETHVINAVHHIWLLTPRGRTSERKPRRPENPTGKGGVGGKLNGCWGQGTSAGDKERVLGTRNE